MIDIFRSLRTLFKISHVHIDNNIFRLHYSFTVLILLAFCVLVTTKQYVGEPIDCMKWGDSVSQSVINTFCWIHTTYTIPSGSQYDPTTMIHHYDLSAFGKVIGLEVPHPGIDRSTNPREFKYHKYYQWISFVLFIQATLFYLPRWLWKMWEGGKIQALMMDLNVAILNELEKKQKKELIINYLVASRGHHTWYCYRFFICEFLAFANIVFQMWALNRFFDGEFYRYGLDVIKFAQVDSEMRIDPMIRVFPRMTKCQFYRYGPSSNIETVDALCLLPINIINEKIYIFIWFWFIILGVLTSFMLILHFLVVVCSPLRVYIMNLQFKMVSFEHLNIIVNRSCCSDWFLLYMLGQNIDSVLFIEILEDLAAQHRNNLECLKQ